MEDKITNLKTYILMKIWLIDIKNLPESSLYAPTPTFILFGFVSLLNASVTPMIGSGGPMGTCDQKDRVKEEDRAGRPLNMVLK